MWKWGKEWNRLFHFSSGDDSLFFFVENVFLYINILFLVEEIELYMIVEESSILFLSCVASENYEYNKDYM